MSHSCRHPNEPLVEIVGIEEGGRGRSCEEHDVCGTALSIDCVVRFRYIQIINGKLVSNVFNVVLPDPSVAEDNTTVAAPSYETDAGTEESAIGVYWVTDGVDRCLVGFLPRHCIPHYQMYDGRVAQVVEFLNNAESPLARLGSRSKRGVCMAAFLQEQ